MSHEIFKQNPNIKNPQIHEASRILNQAIEKGTIINCARQNKITFEGSFRKFNPSEIDQNNFYEEARFMMENMVATEDTYVIISLIPAS